MPRPRNAEPENSLALRVGAGSLYLVVGLLIGLAVAFGAIAMGGQQESLPSAAIVFGVSGLCALLAAVFPNTALSAFAPAAHFFWGFLHGALIPEWVGTFEVSVDRLTRWLFWLGVAAGIAVYLAWLLH